MALSEAEFTQVVEAGCGRCPGSKLVVEALVTQKLPLLGGEPYGSPSWAYKGEELVQGTFRIGCDTCKAALFTATDCPKCHAEGGVARALETLNDFPLLARCAGCGSELLVAKAFVPVRVMYERKRTQKAHAEAAPEEEGFHAFHLECTRCHAVVEKRTGCAVCG